MGVGKPIEIRTLGAEGCADLIQMASDEGWNPGIHDAETFFRIDPGAFLGCFEGEDFAGGGAIVRHDEKFGFMGLFIVRTPFRGRGLGRELWFERRNRLLARLSEGASIGLDGVTEMVPFYAKGGFVPQYVTTAYATASEETGPEHPGIFDLPRIPTSEIVEMDLRAFPSARPAYLSAWLDQREAACFGFRDDSGRLCGYGVLRPCRVGYKVGPLFAESAEVAEALLRALMRGVVGQRVAIAVPEVNAAAVELVKRLGMEPVFACTRMYYGPVPDYDRSLIYGLTSFELG